MKKITVYTPTFNRAYCLGDLYESLLRQTNKNFLWLIIDDGSSDQTNLLVEKWKNEEKIEIQYVYKENGGMHTAHNTAYNLIETELNVCIDSDDYMTDDAVEKIINFWDANGNEDCGGIYALDIDKKGKIIGEKFPDDLKSFKGWGSKIIYYGDNKKVKVVGDKKFISVTKTLKKYPPIPVFDNEKYYSLYYKQHFIEKDYTILILNEPVCVVEYLTDGSSHNMYSQYVKNPKGFQHLRISMIKIAPNLQFRFTESVHYINSCFLLKEYNVFRKSPNYLLTFLALPFGILLHWLTLYKHNQLLKSKKI